MIDAAIDLSGIERKLDLMIDAAKNPAPAMRTFGTYLRGRIKGAFATEGPPLAAATLAHRASAGAKKVEKGLSRALARANVAVKRQEAEQGRQALIALFGGRQSAKVRRPGYKIVARRKAALAKFRRRRRGGFVATTDANLKDRQKVDAATDKAIAAAVNQPILGRAADTIRAKVKGDTLTVDSRWEILDAHHKGATVGHGAKLPARPRVELEEGDMDVLVEVMRNHLLVAFE